MLASQRVELTISRWLSEADWPLVTAPAPAQDQLEARRNVGNSETAGTFRSHKRRPAVAYESSLECAVLNLLERSHQIDYYQEQPVEILYEFNGTSRCYFPDIFAVTTVGRGLLIEVKPLLNMALSLNRAKADAARRWAHARGWGWITVDGKGTFLDLVARPLPPGGRAHLDNELRERGRLEWPDVLAARARYGMAASDIAAYVVQTNARFTLEPRYAITAARNGPFPPEPLDIRLAAHTILIRTVVITYCL